MKIKKLLSYLSFMLLATLIACSSSDPAERILGEWTIDTKSMTEMMMSEVSEKEKQMVQLMLPMIESMKINITFTEKEMIMKMSVMGQEENTKGTYEILETNGDTITVNLKAESEQDSGTFKVTFLSDSKIEMVDPETPDQKMILVK